VRVLTIRDRVRLGQDDEAARQRMASTVIEAARAFESNGKVRMPGTARCIVGTR
jgi:hypothetical protein